MARTPNQILETMLGQLLIRDASQTAAFEALTEAHDKLKKDYDALKAAQNIPPDGEKSGEG